MAINDLKVIVPIIAPSLYLPKSLPGNSIHARYRCIIVRSVCQGDQILVSSEVPDETAFPRASRREWVVALVGRVEGREALGKKFRLKPSSVA